MRMTARKLQRGAGVETTKRTQIELPESEHAQFKQFAKDNGMTFAGLLRVATKEFIKSKEGGK